MTTESTLRVELAEALARLARTENERNAALSAVTDLTNEREATLSEVDRVRGQLLFAAGERDAAQEDLERDDREAWRQCDSMRGERDTALAACAAMRDALSVSTTSLLEDRELRLRALSSDAGKGWASPEVVAQAIEALENVLRYSTVLGAATERGVRAALAALKGVGR